MSTQKLRKKISQRMPHLGDIPEEAEAREFGVDNAVDDATCCVPGRGAIFAGIPPEFRVVSKLIKIKCDLIFGCKLYLIFVVNN